jgi:transposase
MWPLLKGLVRELLATIQDERRRNEQLTQRLDLLLKRVYGPRADTLDPRSALLFDEPPAESPGSDSAAGAGDRITTP